MVEQRSELAKRCHHEDGSKRRKGEINEGRLGAISNIVMGQRKDSNNHNSGVQLVVVFDGLKSDKKKQVTRNLTARGPGRVLSKGMRGGQGGKRSYVL